MPAGFQNGEVASSATAPKAPPMPTARAPTGILRNSAAYLVAPAGTAPIRHSSAATATRFGLGLMLLLRGPGWKALRRKSIGAAPIKCQPVAPSASTRACSLHRWEAEGATG